MKYRPEYNIKIIGKNLKRLREMKRLSVTDVQKYLRLGSPQAVYKYESGRGYPQADTMLALMELYEADLHDIVDDHEKVKENPDKPAANKVTKPTDTQLKNIKTDIGKDENTTNILLQTVNYMLYTKKLGDYVIVEVSLEADKKSRLNHLIKYYEYLIKHKAG